MRKLKPLLIAVLACISSFAVIHAQDKSPRLTFEVGQSSLPRPALSVGE